MMKPLIGAGSIAATVFLLFLMLGALVGRWLGLVGTQLIVLRLGLGALGLAAALLLFFHLRARALRKPARPDDELDGAFAAADRRLRASGRRGGIRGRPVVLVVGPAGSARTTTLVRSGLDAELLAGEVFRGDQVVATATTNIWLGSDIVWVEAGAPLLADAGRWQRLTRLLRPARAGAVLARGAQPPRMAVVCFGCDEFLKPAASDEVAAAAQRIRTRLTELSTGLGIRLPVYVVFTKADRIPFFLDFVRSMTNEETQQVLGATLPLARAVDAGAYAEHEGARLQHAFGRILHALALRRLDVLPRESVDEVRAGAYEFPRELRKVAPLATRFLLDLCRPSQLGASPFLRGFYFTGVRPVMVNDAPISGAPASAPAPGAAEATAVFDVRSIAAAARQAVPTGSRRVPQWSFLPRVFPQLVARDRAAMGVTAGGARVDLPRRALSAAAIIVLLLLATGFTVSWAGNRAMVRHAAGAMRGADDVGLAVVHPLPADELARLDSLRVAAARLRGWQQDGRPGRLGFGLYTGNRVLPELRAVYFSRFDRGMWARTREDLGATVAAMPAQPVETADYGSSYAALKSYLITTSHPHESTREFLAPVLLTYWRGNREVDPATEVVATRQFEFFADELPLGHPLPAQPSERVVQDARNYLGGFADASRFYQALLAGAGAAGAAPVNFHRVFPGSEQVVRSEVVVPAAFTREGWAYVQRSLRDVDALFARESWVLGDRVIAPADRQRLASELGARYVDDYRRTWTQFITSARVLPFQGVPDAARKLGRLADNQSPLLQLLAVTSMHTAVDSGVIRRAFQPVHAVVPPDVTDRYISESNQGYVQGLIGLQSAMERAAAEQGPGRSAALVEASTVVDMLKMQVRQLAQGFSVDDDARPVGAAVQQLMLAPLGDGERLARSGPAAEANEKGASFCGAFRPLMAKYPFNLRGASEATLDEVLAMFQPNASRLSAFETESLQGLVVPQGSGYGAAPGATPRPTAAFLQFFTRAKNVSRGLFTADGGGPEVAFTMRPQATELLPEIYVSIDGQRQEVSRTSQASRTFVWDAARSGEARIEALLGGNRVTLFASSGTWSVFRMFHQARWQAVRPNQYLVTWNFSEPQATLTAEVSFDRGVAIFDPGFFAGLGCVPRVVE